MGIIWGCAVTKAGASYTLLGAAIVFLITTSKIAALVGGERKPLRDWYSAFSVPGYVGVPAWKAHEVLVDSHC